MDTALVLKQKIDAGEIIDFCQASDYLVKSDILNDLLTDFDFDALNLLNRLIEISEIPFAYQLEKVHKWMSMLVDSSSCDYGFSITGKNDDILSCYNSMITSVLVRMKYPDQDCIDKGIAWICKYQNLERGAKNKWTGARILKYGGCMKTTPCYIGVVKAMIALSDYKKSAGNTTTYEVEKKLEVGLNYILDHQIYLRQSSGQPITKDIYKLTYPFSYKTNVIEILRLLKDNNLDSDSRCDLAKTYIQSKKQKDGFWKTNRSYFPKYWIPFDDPKGPGLWISYEINKLIG